MMESTDLLSGRIDRLSEHISNHQAAQSRQLSEMSGVMGEIREVLKHIRADTARIEVTVEAHVADDVRNFGGLSSQISALSSAQARFAGIGTAAWTACALALPAVGVLLYHLLFGGH